MDKIQISRISVRNITGVDNWERERRQPIFISATAHLNVQMAGDQDALKCSVNYGTLSKKVIEFSEKSDYRTVEALALGISHRLLTCFENIEIISIVVEKPKALLFAKCAGVQVSRRRRRHQSEPSLGDSSSIEIEPVPELPPDLIFISGLEIYTIIGLNPWEREERQKVVLDVTIYPQQDLNQLGDHILPAFDYRNIARSLVGFLEKSRYKTLEALVTAATRVCIKQCHVDKITIKAGKPSALLFAELAAVECTRSRKDFEVVDSEQFDISKGRIVFIALGTNVGNRMENINNALSLIEKSSCTILDCSFLYETRPMYVQNQDNFLNGVVKISSGKSPIELLQTLKDIEHQVGRIETYRNGPRVIDLDILYFDNIIFKDEQLQIPHPRIKEREFVLVPLCDIAPDLENPVSRRTSVQMLQMLKQRQKDELSSFSNVVQVFPIGTSLFKTNGKTLIMGIINVTPDSFSDGGDFFISSQHGDEWPQDFLKKIGDRVEQMIDSGCDIIDIGGQSTRPNAETISEEEELRRVLPVVKFLAHEKKIKIPISIDTFRAKVAEECLDSGAEVINDVSGGTRDSNMLSVMAKSNRPVCLMHLRGDSKTMTSLVDYSSYHHDNEPEVVSGVREELFSIVSQAMKSGVRRWNIIVDPGIGFAKDSSQNLSIFKGLKQIFSKPVAHSTHLAPQYLTSLHQFPILVGPSRKKFISKILGTDTMSNRIWGTAAACSACVAGGASILRVHDVQEMSDVVKVADSIWKTSSL